MATWPTNSSRTKTWGSEVLTAADLHTQLDLLHQYFVDSLHATTGHGHTGGTNDGPKISLTAAVSGTLPLANGGTGQTTLAGLLGLVYPVGSIYINATNSTNPGTLLGFGTWTAFGAGRVPVGFNSGDTDFDTAEETGGGENGHNRPSEFAKLQFNCQPIKHQKRRRGWAKPSQLGKRRKFLHPYGSIRWEWDGFECHESLYNCIYVEAHSVTWRN